MNSVTVTITACVASNSSAEKLIELDKKIREKLGNKPIDVKREVLSQPE